MRQSEPDTSITLIRRLGQPSDDPLGWPRFAQVYTPLLLRWCRAKGLREHDAQDVTQEILLTIARQAERFCYDPSRRFRGYLRRLTHAAWCDWVERHRPWHHANGDTAAHRLLESIADPNGPPARMGWEADQEQLELAMRRVRARVESRTWAAFQLLAVEGLSGDEAAARLGMRRGSAFAARCKVQRLIRLEVDRLGAVDEAG